ncbi:ATP-binding cassette domain-containing protein [Catenulispora sp. NL8]|uniref:ATP-binding cassette domain-containing protein n=1 Tax=Catenulispora pinistramenti TaxID=2705254 RepID=A0ABS5KTT2_9ACTN|nr:ATP-binding cassette domain-containing protein [Catenulispora pinistramenti]MBS2549447.1 ATP-binding cassette domain-containing protein [Catenulispora pinistramenti]
MAVSPPAIEVSGLRKAYGDKTVLDGIDLSVPQGSIYALLGPNGAGKTTVVNILTTLLPADSGTARILGDDVRRAERIRPLISVTGQFAAVDNLLTGEENLIMMANLYRLGRGRAKALAAELLEKFDLTAAGKARGVTYSGGMRRRLDLAMTLVAEPRVIFLDEPTTGLDPRSRHAMWEIVRDLTGRGVTIFLTTQYLEEADQLADRIGVLDHGVLVAEGSADELKRRMPGASVRLEFSAAEQLAAAAGLLAEAERDPKALALRVPTDGALRSLRVLLDRLDDAGVEVAKVSVLSADLDDVFLALTERPPDSMERPAAVAGRPTARKEML